MPTKRSHDRTAYWWTESSAPSLSALRETLYKIEQISVLLSDAPASVQPEIERLTRQIESCERRLMAKLRQAEKKLR